MTPSGHIGLQVHQVGSDPTKAGLHAKFRNLRIREIQVANNTVNADEQKAGWRLLWDGKTAEGWRSAKSENFPAGGWTMKDGVLTIHENGGQPQPSPAK